MLCALDRVLDILTLQADAGSQNRNEDICPICFDSLANGTIRACDAPQAVHMFHHECLSHIFQHQTYQRRELTCPTCRRPATTGWKKISVGTLSGHLSVAVNDDFTVIKLKNQLKWAFGMPVSAMRIISTRPEPIKQLADTDSIQDRSGIFVVFRMRSPDLVLFIDIPRCARAPAKYRCPISEGLLLNPTKGADGQIYERCAIDLWMIKQGDKSPINGGNILPLTAVNDIYFNREVREFTPDPVYTQPPDETEIHIKIVSSFIEDQFPMTFKLRDSLQHVANSFEKPNQKNITSGDGFIFEVSETLTLGRCRVKDGDVLYFQA